PRARERHAARRRADGPRPAEAPGAEVAPVAVTVRRGLENAGEPVPVQVGELELRIREALWRERVTVGRQALEPSTSGLELDVIELDRRQRHHPVVLGHDGRSVAKHVAGLVAGLAWAVPPDGDRRQRRPAGVPRLPVGEVVAPDEGRRGALLANLDEDP